MAERADTPVVRRLTAGEAAALRELRLRALADAPAAFASNHADEAALGDDHWQRLAAASERGDESTVMVAASGGRLIGMAAGWWLDSDRSIAQLSAVWVEPAARRLGVGAALVAAVRDWAADGGALFVRLGVVEPGGERAKRFYASLGFVELDDPVPMRIDRSRLCAYMARPV